MFLDPVAQGFPAGFEQSGGGGNIAFRAGKGGFDDFPLHLFQRQSAIQG